MNLPTHHLTHRLLTGDVTAIGGDVDGVEVGATVLYNKFGIGCTDIEMGGASYVMISANDLIGRSLPTAHCAQKLQDPAPCGLSK